MSPKNETSPLLGKLVPGMASSNGFNGLIESNLGQRAEDASRIPLLEANGHPEQHSAYGAVIRDGIIGFSDGLTVPFALTAGLSSLGNTKLVVMGGLAELFSGAISMGLGGYLASATERAHYLSEEAREWDEIKNCPGVEREEIYQILGAYHVSREASTPLVESLCRNPQQWVRFMMDFELKMEKPDINRVWISALTLGLSYFIGGLIPMVPYFIMEEAAKALFVSIGITIVILLAFGYLKNWVTIRNKRAGLWGALQTLVVGMVSAGTSYAIVRALDAKEGL